jgi:hypothetical protein
MSNPGTSSTISENVNMCKGAIQNGGTDEAPLVFYPACCNTERKLWK